MKSVLCLGAIMGLWMTAAQANVYHCVVNGQNVYTSKKSGNCKEAQLNKIGSYSSDQTIIRRQNEQSAASIAAAKQPNGNAPQTNQQAAAPKPRANQVAAAAPASSMAPAAKPANNPQSQRDQGRREILMTELSNEKKALAQARLALTNGRLIRSENDERKQQSMVSLQRAVDDRMQNVQALQNELSRM